MMAMTVAFDLLHHLKQTDTRSLYIKDIVRQDRMLSVGLPSTINNLNACLGDMLCEDMIFSSPTLFETASPRDCSTFAWSGTQDVEMLRRHSPELLDLLPVRREIGTLCF
ncbi:hypothetical protein ABZX51_003837 [Aspergillus tubingensis]